MARNLTPLSYYDVLEACAQRERMEEIALVAMLDALVGVEGVR